MRPDKVIDHLSIFTPALLDIAELDEQQARELVVYGHYEVPAYDQAQLYTLVETHRALRNKPEDMSEIIHALELSLGALVRVTDHFEEFRGLKKIAVGHNIQAVARLSITYATKFGYRFNGQGKRRLFYRRNNPREHIQQHQESYVALKPLMSRSQQKKLEL